MEQYEKFEDIPLGVIVQETNPDGFFVLRVEADITAISARFPNPRSVLTGWCLDTDPEDLVGPFERVTY